MIAIKGEIIMKLTIQVLIYFMLFYLSTCLAQDKIKVVTTLTTYANIAEIVGGDAVDVAYIVPGDQDAHFVRPKPSFAVLLNQAQLFVTTGLDLELWVPSLVDMSKNDKIRSGQIGYVAAYDGIELQNKPAVLSRSEGGLHIYGNPHITTNPLFYKIIAENIVIGLEKLAPRNSDNFRRNLSEFQNRIDQAVFGEELVRLMGSSLLTKLVNSGQLISFLSAKEYRGNKMITYLGGWLKEGLIFRDKKMVTYHKNWGYLAKLFGIEIIGYVEPKPGIPPSPKHLEQLLENMKSNNVKVLLAANYYDESKVKNICEKVNATPIIIPMYVNGAPDSENVFKLVDLWIKKTKAAFE
jgi:ABC-type Zn uptake system ZnuABC Zn-binding protein ZnuA